MIIFKAYDKVRITYQERTEDGIVLLASHNGRSLMLVFDGMLGGYVGMMPVFWENDNFFDLGTNELVDLEALES